MILDQVINWWTECLVQVDRYPDSNGIRIQLVEIESKKVFMNLSFNSNEIKDQSIVLDKDMVLLNYQGLTEGAIPALEAAGIIKDTGEKILIEKIGFGLPTSLCKLLVKIEE